ncbi:uncharacterized protein LOC128213410 [Mya arenaria]|uniref:uncharacterized protein LOC128213410 n=1 Tax=Mya arenaria TaxID=6604 RepID=UPI0022DF0784|nr:uncharacterized protein LOC128213410 [Mya arenaria]XP_052775030.1 uncharacterized protein LOC128213410 [Mya arenaria]XP_052775031.1 uncharacterized protein LOC128213410 [Mya arenaria]
MKIPSTKHCICFIIFYIFLVVCFVSLVFHRRHISMRDYSLLNNRKILISKYTVEGVFAIAEEDSFTQSAGKYINYSHAFSYKPFNILKPKFGDLWSETVFLKNPDNIALIGTQSQEKLQGEIVVVRNGTLDLNTDCGYRASSSAVKRNQTKGITQWYSSIIPLYVPDGHTFQHFLDGMLPKIIQVLPTMRMFKAKLLLRYPRDEIIFDILKKLNISREQLIFIDSTNVTVGADFLIFTCITPPLHPYLWKTARKMVGAPEIPDAWTREFGMVILLTRKGCHNCGRIIQNEVEVLHFLESRYGKDTVSLFQGSKTLLESIDTFGKARIIIGAHGGAFYNINFAPAETVLVEVMPTNDDGSELAASKTIFWAQADMLDQVYWRICERPLNDKGDVNVNIIVLENILEIVDNKQLKTKTV